MRLIDADELEKVATEDWFLDMIAAQDSKSAVRKDIVNLIDSVPLAEENNNGWIPCVTGKFPKDGERVLLSFANFSIPCVGRYEEDVEGGAFYIGDEDESCVSQDMIVNAWMPLPKCYHED